MIDLYARYRLVNRKALAVANWLRSSNRSPMTASIAFSAENAMCPQTALTSWFLTAGLNWWEAF
jgi:hypothetical protein